jgi:hypothetical protein
MTLELAETQDVREAIRRAKRHSPPARVRSAVTASREEKLHVLSAGCSLRRQRAGTSMLLPAS